MATLAGEYANRELHRPVEDVVADVRSFIRDKCKRMDHGPTGQVSLTHEVLIAARILTNGRVCEYEEALAICIRKAFSEFS